MTRAMVTGSGGFIGKALVERLTKDGVEVIGLDVKTGCDLTDRTAPWSWKNVDVIFHMAGVSDGYSVPGECVRVNLLSTLNLLERVKDSGSKFVFASTYLNDEGAYATSKRICENIVKWRERQGLRTLVVRCCNVYGPGDFNTNRIIPSLITKMLANEPVTVKAVRRDFAFIADVVDTYVRFASKPVTLCNVSGTGLISLMEVANRLKEIIGSSSTITLLETGSDAPQRASDTIADLGAEKTFLDEGLRKTVEWWRGL